jgi:hypothetical protein
VDALEDLVRLCVELDRLGQGGEARPDTTATWAALEQAVIGKTTSVLLHSSRCSDLRRCRQHSFCASGAVLPT